MLTVNIRIIYNINQLKKLGLLLLTIT